MCMDVIIKYHVLKGMLKKPNYQHYRCIKISELTEWNKKSFYRIKVLAKLHGAKVDFTIKKVRNVFNFFFILIWSTIAPFNFSYILIL